MKILLLAPFPYGVHSGQGGATVSFNALKALSLQHEVHVLCFSAHTAADQAAVSEMQALAKSVQNVALQTDKWRVLVAKLRGLFTSTPEQAVYFESAAYQEALRTTLAAVRPDIVITQFPQMAQYLPFCQGYRTVHDVQDAFSVSAYRRVKTADPGWRRWYAEKQWRSWVAYESRYYPQAHQCWTLSAQDQYGLTVFTPGLEVLCMGLPLADLAEPAAQTASGKVGFIASFGHAPNIEAVHHLMRHIAPLVRARSPEIEFWIAGRNPPATLLKAAPGNVKFIGYVDSLAEFYASCDLIVAPLQSGGGVKIKVAEALCHGKAVLTTPIGAEGIPITHQVHAIVESEPHTFAQAICTLMASPASRAALAAAGFALAEQAFATSAWAERVNQQLAYLAAPRSEEVSHVQ